MTTAQSSVPPIDLLLAPGYKERMQLSINQMIFSGVSADDAIAAILTEELAAAVEWHRGIADAFSATIKKESS